MENKEKFTGKAQIYERYRPDYPVAVYNFITENMGLPDDAVIADIGAGTGIFSMPLIKRGYKVCCVEPNADMKLVLDDKAKNYPNYIGLNSSAEHTNLQGNSVDLITVAQAFHWFDRQAFKEECKRILKLNGKVVLLWNVKDEDWQLTKELAEINKKYCPNYKVFSGGLSSIGVEQFNDFFKVPCRTMTFDNHVFDDHFRQFVGRCLSCSYALKEGDENFENYKEALRELFFKHADDMWTVIKNKTIIYWGEV